jgi:hypothetical protein
VQCQSDSVRRQAAAHDIFDKDFLMPLIVIPLFFIRLKKDLYRYSKHQDRRAEKRERYQSDFHHRDTPVCNVFKNGYKRTYGPMAIAPSFDVENFPRTTRRCRHRQHRQSPPISLS